jgi:hypothetical protein
MEVLAKKEVDLIVSYGGKLVKLAVEGRSALYWSSRSTHSFDLTQREIRVILSFWP